MAENNLESQPNSETESKHRRLVPQFSLNNRQDLKPSSHHENPKKTVIRFTREQLISLRKTSSVLPTMSVMAEIVSPESQEPVCFSKLEPEDVTSVIRIWNAATKDMGNRGRGRGRSNSRLVVSEDGNEDENQGHSNADLWDDGGLLGSSEGKDFDLTEISKASLQFRSDMENLKLSTDIEITAKEVDAVESLIDQALAEASARKEESAVKFSEPTQTSSSFPLNPTSTSSVSVPIREEPLTNLAVPTFSINSSTIDASHEKVILADSTPFLKGIINDSGFLSSVPATASSLLTQSFPVNSLFQSQPALYPPIDPEWFYTDPQQQIQGPFSQENMRLWNEAGYFAKDLPIKLRHWTSFHLFKDVFPEGRLAFYTVPSEPVRPAFSTPDSNISFILPLERNLNSVIPESSRRISSVEFERSLIQDKPSLVLGNSQLIRSSLLHTETSTIISEIPKFDSLHQQGVTASSLNVSASLQEEKPQAEVHSAAVVPEAIKPAVDKSDYAKQILGISRKSKEPEIAPAPKLVPSESTEENLRKDSKLTDSKPKVHVWKTAETNVTKPVSFLEVQQEAVEEQKVLKEKVITPTSSSSPSAATVANPAAMSVQLKSLLGLKSLPATHGSTVPVKAKSAWSSTQPDVPSVPLTEIMREEINQTKTKKDDLEKPRGTSWAAKISSRVEVPTVATNTIQVSPKPAAVIPVPTVDRLSTHTGTRPISKANDRSDFGGKKMSKELADWCSAQLKSIKGIEDVTLMEFCMSLNSAVEIRETLASYLGSSPQVTNFATEFIKYKDEGKLPSNKISSGETSVSNFNGNPKKKKGGK